MPTEPTGVSEAYAFGTTRDGFPVVEPAVAGTLYQMFAAIHSVLTDLDLTYWAAGGTALGMERHGGLIPWDDDGDFCFSPDAHERLAASPSLATEVGKRFERLGLTWLHFADRGLYRLYPTALAPGRTAHFWHGQHFHVPFADLFVMRHSETEDPRTRPALDPHPNGA